MKILYIATISNTVNAFLIPHIKMLIDDGHKVDVAFKVQEVVNKQLLDLGCKVYDIDLSRSPLNVSNVKAYWEIKKIVNKGKYDIIHTHTPIASTVSRLACRKINNLKVIYTAHGFHFYNGAPVLNWIIYYPIEKYLSKFTDILITINKEDYSRAKSSFKAKSTEYIPGIGIDVEKFQNTSIDRAKKRAEIGVPEDAFVLLSVGELNKNKNHEVIIKALPHLSDLDIMYLICGDGLQRQYLLDLTVKLGLSDKVKFLGFRKDIADICKISDLFVFPSKREGLPVALMEAMSTGLPIICANIRGNNDLVDNGITGYMFELKNANMLGAYLRSMVLNPDSLVQMGKRGKSKVLSFSKGNVLTKISEIYRNL